MNDTQPTTIAIIGGGPAGLMAAETAIASGARVDLYDAKGSVGRKFLIAGKGGLNLTHSEPFEAFVARFGTRRSEVEVWMRQFGPDDLREWARGLGVETFIGTSGRVFPLDLKAAPLLRGWVRRLRSQGVRFHTHRRWVGWSGGESDPRRGMTLRDANGVDYFVDADAVILATGGASWPELGSDGSWVQPLRDRGAEVAELQPANCGFDLDWSEHFGLRHAGAPVKPVVAHWHDTDGCKLQRQGEFVVTRNGVEGSLIYAMSAALRDAIARDGSVTVQLDLAPGRDYAALRRNLAKPRQGKSMASHLRKQAAIDGVKAGLLYEMLTKPQMDDAATLASAIKSLPLRLLRPRPVAETISTAGGVRLECLDAALMIRALPGVFCAGEMLDWEAPTGGYLLTASFASGRIAAMGALNWLRARSTA